MKTIFDRSLWLWIGALFVALTSCEDNMEKVGASTLPETDGIVMKTVTVPVESRSAYRDSIYVRTGYPLLGRLSDPEFGEIEASYLAQFYSSSEFTLNGYNSADSCIFDLLRTSAPAALGYKWDDFKYIPWDSICGNQLDSMTLRIYYQTYYGDSLTPMKLSVWGLDPDVEFEALSEKEFYSNTDFSKFTDEENFLGSKGYTSADRANSDSVRSLSTYMPFIEIKLNDALKDKFYRAAVEAAISRDEDNPHHGDYQDVFKSSSAFRKNLLSGICVKPTFGDGSLIKVYYTAIYFFYSSFHKYDEDGSLLRNFDDSADSTYVTKHTKYIAVTPDVIQMSGYSFDDPDKATRLADKDTTYVSSPEGYYTIVDFPVGKIISTMMNDPLRDVSDSSYFLNAANFYLQGYKPKGVLMNATPTPTLLMVENSELGTFFENSKTPDYETTTVGSYVADSTDEKVYYYNFGNLNSLVLGLAEKHGWVKEDNTSLPENYTVPMALVPVELNTNSTYGTILSSSTYILPSAMKLKRGDNAQQLQVVYTIEGRLK